MANEDGTDSSPNTLNVTQMKFPGFSSPHLPPLHSKLGDLVLAHSIGKERMYWGGERRGWFPADYILSHEKRRGRKKLKEGRDIGVLLLRGHAPQYILLIFIQVTSISTIVSFLRSQVWTSSSSYSKTVQPRCKSRLRTPASERGCSITEKIICGNTSSEMLSPTTIMRQLSNW
jgi:hypothetical protein